MIFNVKQECDVYFDFEYLIKMALFVVYNEIIFPF